MHKLIKFICLPCILGCFVFLTSCPYNPPISTPVRIEPTDTLALYYSNPTVVKAFEYQKKATSNNEFSANIVYNRPDTMQLGTSTEITLVVGRANQFSHSSLRFGELDQSDHVVEANRQITQHVGARLTGSNFEISPSEEIKQVITNDKVRWNWSVKPESVGTHKLTLIIYNYLEIDGQESKQQLKALKDDIYIFSLDEPFKKKVLNFVLDNVQWLLTLLIIPLIVKIREYLRKRKTKMNHNRNFH